MSPARRACTVLANAMLVVAALAAALKEGRIGGAFIDVFEDEPLPADNVFDGVPNVALTPHCAGLTKEALLRSSMMIADAVRDALERAG